jgi:hypothetical protein
MLFYNHLSFQRLWITTMVIFTLDLLHIPVKPISDSEKKRPLDPNNKTGQYIVHHVDGLVC